METKLMNAALLLPQPCLEFRTIEQKMNAAPIPTRKPRTLLRVALAVVLILCLCITVFAYGKLKYGLWSGYRSNSFADVEMLSRRYDYFFPEELNGSPFLQMSTSLGAPQGASHLDAILTPTYKLHSVDYSQITVSFGTTKRDTWKYHFSVAEDGSCSDEDVKPESQSIAEYKGYTLHLYAIADRYSVRWVDEARKLVIDITCFDAESFDIALETVKLLIDLNE